MDRRWAFWSAHWPRFAPEQCGNGNSGPASCTNCMEQIHQSDMLLPSVSQLCVPRDHERARVALRISALCLGLISRCPIPLGMILLLLGMHTFRRSVGLARAVE